MSSKFFARIEGEVAYTDGTSASFGGILDDNGSISVGGDASAMGDIIATVKSLFTALGGSLTCAPAVSGKTVADKTALLALDGIYGATTDVEAMFTCFAEYVAKVGVTTGGGGSTAYAIAKTHFNSQVENLVAAVAGVTATVS